MELVQADVLARYARQQKKKTIFATGTDEHGQKVMEKAEEANQTPQEFVDESSKSFKDLAKTLNVSNDRFIRTTDKAHEQRAQLIWKNLSKDIYKGSYKVSTMLFKRSLSLKNKQIRCDLIENTRKPTANLR